MWFGENSYKARHKDKDKRNKLNLKIFTAQKRTHIKFNITKTNLMSKTKHAFMQDTLTSS